MNPDLPPEPAQSRAPTAFARSWQRLIWELRRPRRLTVFERGKRRRGVALVLVLGSLAILAVMLTEFQDETSADLGHALSERDGIKAEYAAKSGLNLARLLIASEPTIRKAVAPLFMMMRRGPPQIPVWEFADQVLGAFNDAEGASQFKSLTGIALTQGQNLGLEGAGFEIVVVDEDSKLNLNSAAKGDAFSQQRMAVQILGLLAGPQNNPLFDQKDSRGNFNTRQDVCSALVDWSDPDVDQFPCDISGQFVQPGAEDNFYQLLEPPYERKNGAFDSLDELHMVRGINDDFWAAFIEPDPLDPKKRVATVWGQGKVNVNTANAQTLLAVICGSAVENTPLCVDPLEQTKFLTVVGLIRTLTSGAPMFSSEKGFVQALKGQGMFGSVMTALQMQPVVFRSDDEVAKGISAESKVFSIYATGTATSGTRKTIRRIHEVVDFRGAPAPPNLLALAAAAASSAGGGSAPPMDPSQMDPTQQAALMQQAGQAALPPVNLPEGATADALQGAFRPDPGGRVIYYRNE
ncbi:MAG TPA: type II secretion system protein GspK [Polyangiaceae bacterium]|jgi:general secretion pathway protein K|nr:type II secretion system protein GspK [Polyangiaceae bacterium]